MSSAQEVIDFWRQAGPARWFARDDAFDDAFRTRFLDLHMAAAGRQLDQWMENAEGALALMLLLDQFPRNCFRGTAHMYATDPLALYFAEQAMERRLDLMLDAELRMFLYLPFEHSEDSDHQRRAVELFQPLGGEGLEYALVHQDIIARFGRFPHRNPMLGRETTPAEQAFLDGGGFAG